MRALAFRSPPTCARSSAASCSSAERGFIVREVLFDGSWPGWRATARAALADDLAPDEVRWRPATDEQDSLFAAEVPPHGANRVKQSAPDGAATGGATPSVPRTFLALAADVACHADAERWSVLYRVLWRLTHGERHLLHVFVDDDVHRLQVMAKTVRREGHKLRAFVRFRLVGGGTAHERYVAWFEPEHDVVAREAPFFVRRFPAMRWSILTPGIAAHWDGVELTYAPGVSRLDAPRGDDLERLWRVYYANIFNPARVKPRMMRSEMPERYWKHLPEASLIAPLLREAPARVQRMIERQRHVAHVDEEVALARVRSDRARAELGAWGVTPGASPLAHRRVRIGTASWTDPTMTARGVFYPDGTRSAAARLAYYATRFSLVEADSTFYALPSERNAALWAERTPGGFVFDVKAHALMTGHATAPARLPRDLRDSLPAQLRDSAMVLARDIPPEVTHEVWRRFMHALRPLRDAGKLGALLLQLPRDFTPSRESERVIAGLRERAGDDALCAVEFRHADWVIDTTQRERTLALLRAHDLAYVMVDAPPGFATSMPPIVAVTSDRLAVVRLHGRRTDTWARPVTVTSERYRYLYDAVELAEWVPRIIDVAERVQGVHVVLNNCHANYGTSNADEITALLIEADRARRRLHGDGN